MSCKSQPVRLYEEEKLESNEDVLWTMQDSKMDPRELLVSRQKISSHEEMDEDVLQTKIKQSGSHDGNIAGEILQESFMLELPMTTEFVVYDWDCRKSFQWKTFLNKHRDSLNFSAMNPQPRKTRSLFEGCLPKCTNRPKRKWKRYEPARYSGSDYGSMSSALEGNQRTHDQPREILQSFQNSVQSTVQIPVCDDLEKCLVDQVSALFKGRDPTHGLALSAIAGLPNIQKLTFQIQKMTKRKFSWKRFLGKTQNRFSCSLTWPTRKRSDLLVRLKSEASNIASTISNGIHPEMEATGDTASARENERQGNVCTVKAIGRKALPNDLINAMCQFLVTHRRPKGVRLGLVLRSRNVRFITAKMKEVHGKELLVYSVLNQHKDRIRYRKRRFKSTKRRGIFLHLVREKPVSLNRKRLRALKYRPWLHLSTKSATTTVIHNGVKKIKNSMKKLKNSQQRSAKLKKERQQVNLQRRKQTKAVPDSKPIEGNKGLNTPRSQLLRKCRIGKGKESRRIWAANITTVEFGADQLRPMEMHFHTLGKTNTPNQITGELDSKNKSSTEKRPWEEAAFQGYDTADHGEPVTVSTVEDTISRSDDSTEVPLAIPSTQTKQWDEQSVGKSRGRRSNPNALLNSLRQRKEGNTPEMKGLHQETLKQHVFKESRGHAGSANVATYCSIPDEGAKKTTANDIGSYDNSITQAKEIANHGGDLKKKNRNKQFETTGRTIACDDSATGVGQNGQQALQRYTNTVGAGKEAFLQDVDRNNIDENVNEFQRKKASIRRGDISAVDVSTGYGKDDFQGNSDQERKVTVTKISLSSESRSRDSLDVLHSRELQAKNSVKGTPIALDKSTEACERKEPFKKQIFAKPGSQARQNQLDNGLLEKNTKRKDDQDCNEHKSSSDCPKSATNDAHATGAIPKQRNSGKGFQTNNKADSYVDTKQINQVLTSTFQVGNCFGPNGPQDRGRGMSWGKIAPVGQGSPSDSVPMETDSRNIDCRDSIENTSVRNPKNIESYDPRRAGPIPKQTNAFRQQWGGLKPRRNEDFDADSKPGSLSTQLGLTRYPQVDSHAGRHDLQARGRGRGSGGGRGSGRGGGRSRGRGRGTVTSPGGRGMRGRNVSGDDCYYEKGPSNMSGSHKGFPHNHHRGGGLGNSQGDANEEYSDERERTKGRHHNFYGASDQNTSRENNRKHRGARTSRMTTQDPPFGGSKRPKRGIESMVTRTGVTRGPFRGEGMIAASAINSAISQGNVQTKYKGQGERNAYVKAVSGAYPQREKVSANWSVHSPVNPIIHQNRYEILRRECRESEVTSASIPENQCQAVMVESQWNEHPEVKGDVPDVQNDAPDVLNFLQQSYDNYLIEKIRIFLRNKPGFQEVQNICKDKQVRSVLDVMETDGGFNWRLFLQKHSNIFNQLYFGGKLLIQLINGEE